MNRILFLKIDSTTIPDISVAFYEMHDPRLLEVPGQSKVRGLFFY